MNEPRILGTLVVVVGTAKNLPNKSRFGKQDPFCTVQIGNVKRKTAPIKRGGQHPEWDEELRFPIHEDVDDMLAASTSKPLPGEPGVVTPQTMASKARKAGAKKGAKVMQVAVWADDIKEPELIGEVTVNFDDALSKGEVDDWWTLQSKDGKDKYCGEVYMELTFFSLAAPPQKPRPTPGQAGASPARPHGRPGLPTSTSVSGMNLYIPPYQTPPPAPAAQPQRVSHTYSNHAAQPQVAQHRPLQQQPQRPASNSYGNSSFAELGLPPQQPQPPAPGRPPSLANANALASQMGSMSLGPSHQQRPGANAHQAATIGHGRPQSYVATPPQPSQSGGGPAPWASLLPQNQGQQQQQAPPLPRPVSSNDVNAWHASDPHAAAIPPRPHSSMHHQQPSVPAPPNAHGRTGSLSHSLAPPGATPPAAYGSYQPIPEPPRTASPAQYGGYQSPPPASHPGSFSQALPAPPQQGSYQQPHQQQPYPPQPPAQQPAYGTPGRQSSWPAQNQQYQQPGQPPLPQQFAVPPAGSGPNTPGQQGGYQSGAYGSPVNSAPHRHSLPGTSPAPSTTTGPYVPWHMQTQGVPSPQALGHNAAGGAPAPPAPPMRPGGGYYPSDELYQQQQQQHHQPQQPLPPAHQPPPPQPPQNFGYTSPPPAAHQQAFSPPPQSNFRPNATAPPPRAPSPLPPPPNGGSTSTNSDWRSYLAGLGSVSGAPVPPVGGAQGNDWYNTPPPAVPSSIMQHAQAQNGYGAPPQQQW